MQPEVVYMKVFSETLPVINPQDAVFERGALILVQDFGYAQVTDINLAGNPIVRIIHEGRA